jgi:hypothetical protein
LLSPAASTISHAKLQAAILGRDPRSLGYRVQRAAAMISAMVVGATPRRASSA